MRFLVDSCVPRSVVLDLRAQGHDVAAATEHGPDPGDDAILAWAVTEQRILVTMDKDLPELVYRRRRDHHGVIRLPMLCIPAIVESLRALLTRHSAEELAVSIATLTGSRIRVVKPPRLVD